MDENVKKVLDGIEASRGSWFRKQLEDLVKQEESSETKDKEGLTEI